MDDLEDLVEEEMGALVAILMEDVKVHRNHQGKVSGVEVCVVPATAQNVAEQYVRCTLVAMFPALYPAVQPAINIRNPRGIDDSVLSKIELEIADKCDDLEGNPVIYELVEMVRENLTANNTPSCPCTICLYHFTDTDHFTKTQCFHYFHKHCLGRYISNCEAVHKASLAEQSQPWQQRDDRLVLSCPVCREAIQVEESFTVLLESPSPEGEANDQQWRSDDQEVLALKEAMAKLFLKQKKRGGIIDLEQEKNKFLISQASESRIENLPDMTSEEDIVIETPVSEILTTFSAVEVGDSGPNAAAVLSSNDSSGKTPDEPAVTVVNNSAVAGQETDGRETYRHNANGSGRGWGGRGGGASSRGRPGYNRQQQGGGSSYGRGGRGGNYTRGRGAGASSHPEGSRDGYNRGGPRPGGGRQGYEEGSRPVAASGKHYGGNGRNNGNSSGDNYQQQNYHQQQQHYGYRGHNPKQYAGGRNRGGAEGGNRDGGRHSNNPPSRPYYGGGGGGSKQHHSYGPSGGGRDGGYNYQHNRNYTQAAPGGNNRDDAARGRVAGGDRGVGGANES